MRAPASLAAPPPGTRPARAAARRRAKALVLSTGYLACGWLWIAFSDQVGETVFSTPEAITRFQTYKGIAFILLSALLLYAALAARGAAARHELRRPAPAGLSIVTLLGLLVLATALPLVALLGWEVMRETRAQRAAAEDLVRRVAANTAVQADAFLRGQLQLAGMLAQRPGVRRMDPRSCDPLLSQVDLLGEAVREVAALDPEGRLVCGSQSLAGGAPASRGPRRGTDGAWLFLLAVPVIGFDERPAGTVQLALAAASLEAVVAHPFGQGGASALVDAHGYVVARAPLGENHMGYRALELKASAATRIGPGVDGVQRVLAVEAVGQTGWLAAAGVPLQAIYGPVRAAGVRYGLAALAVLAACAWGVTVFARQIVAPLQALERTARRVGAGEFDQRAVPGGPAELAAVADGFNHMLDSLTALQQQLRRSEERHRHLLEQLSLNVPGMIFTYRRTPDGRVSLPFVSERIRDMFELEPQDVRDDAAPLLARVHPDDAAVVAAVVQQTGVAPGPVVVEYRVCLPSQGIRHYLAQSQPEHGADPDSLWFGCVVDVTRLHEAQQALRDANASLERRIAQRTASLASANEALESFSYSVAHDLRAPLDAIVGFSLASADALARGDTKRAAALNARVRANAQRMAALVDGFLQVAKAGSEPLREIVADMGRMVREVVSEQAGAARARVVVEPLPSMRVDPTTLRQVWWNLLSNALKYSARREQPVVTIDWSLQGEEAVFRVRDNGAGFDPRYADQLFLPFHRLHTADAFEGSGIGLAQVRRILDSHGGRIWAEGQPDGGATFSFALPAARLAAR